MEETSKHNLHASAISNIAGDLEKHCVTAAATVRSLKLSLSRLQTANQDTPATFIRPVSFEGPVDGRHLPSFGDLKAKFSKADAAKVSNTDAATSSVGLKKWNVVRKSLTSSQRVRPLVGGAGAPDGDFKESDTDQLRDDRRFKSVLVQTHIAAATHTDESRRIESGQRASAALRPNVVLLNLPPPPLCTPLFGPHGWLHADGDLVITRTYRPSDASGSKLSEEQYYKYANIDPSALDAHVRASYRLYFGEQVSVVRQSGRVVPSSTCDSDREFPLETKGQHSDPLAFARLHAKIPFLPYSSWRADSYVNLETNMNSNDPFETALHTQSDPRTRCLVQFQSLQMKLLEHPDFRGVEPLFASAYIYSTGKHLGRRVRRAAAG